MLLKWILGDSNASKEERDVAVHYEAELWRNFGKYRQRYIQQYGHVLNTDNAKELCAIYSANKETRARYSSCLYRPAKRFIQSLYDREIGSPRIKTALFLSGGAASGKSVLRDFVKRWKEPLIVDGTLSNHADAKEQITLALACGKEVVVVNVYCPIRAAVRAAIRRALIWGRTMSLEALASSHFHAIKTFIRLSDEYNRRGDPIHFVVVDNSVYEFPEIRDLDFLKNNEYSDLQDIKSITLNEFESTCRYIEQKTGEPIPSYIRAGFQRPGRKVA